MTKRINPGHLLLAIGLLILGGGVFGGVLLGEFATNALLLAVVLGVAASWLLGRREP